MARNLQEIIPAFFVGPDGKPLTPEQAKTRQQLAESLLAKATDTSPTAGGFASILAKSINGIAAGRERHQADEGLRLAGEKDAEIAQALIGGIGAPSTPAASSLPLGAAPVGAVASQPLDPISQRVSDAHGGNAPNVDPRIATGIVETANALGIDPVDLATTISYETGGTFNPTKVGPTTKWGQHRGLIQFGEPQAQQYGVNWEDPIGSQLGANGAVANYLRSRGVKPGMGLLDLYSTINAGSPGLYNRSDAAAGGAPGTVRDKVETQMAGHRAKAQALLTPYLSANGAPDSSSGLMAYAPTGVPQNGALSSAPFESAGLPQTSVDPVIVATTPEEVLAAERATGMVPNPLDLPENQLTFDYAPAQGGDYVDPLVSPQSQMGGAANPNGIVDLGPGTPGEIRTGPDGQTYQYVETNGMAGASGPMGWIRVNTGGLSGQVPANNPGIWGGGMDPNDPSTIPAMAGGTRDILPTGSPGIFPAAPGAIAQAAAPSPSPQGGGAPVGGGLHPAIVQALSSPHASPQTRQIAGMLLKQQMDSQDPYRQAQLAQIQAQTQKLQREATDPNSGETFFGNPVAIQNPDGTIGYGQIGNKGTFRPIQLGEGQTFAPPTKTINTGTEQIIVDQAGNVISRVPIDNRTPEKEKVLGRAEGEAQVAAPGDIQAGMTALDILDQIENHPGIEYGTGATSIANRVPGTSGYDFQNLVEQAKSGAFLTAIQQLRGLGSLSNAEGSTATAAVTRMDTATSKEAFLAALRDYRKVIQQGIDRAKRNLPAPNDDAAPEEASDGIPTVNSQEEYSRIPSGTRYRAPDGSIRTKP